MRKAKFQCYITVAVSPKMRDKIVRDADHKNTSVSKFVRKIIRRYYSDRKSTKKSN